MENVLEDDERDAKRDWLKKQQEFEQSVAWMRESMPPLWYGLYANCVKEGFTEVQALDLVKTFISRPL